MRTFVVGRSYFNGNTFHRVVLSISLLVALPADANGNERYYDSDTQTPIQIPGTATQAPVLTGILFDIPVRNLIFSEKRIIKVHWHL
ncbi:hypothetical protein [Kaarinaea lacus]